VWSILTDAQGRLKRPRVRREVSAGDLRTGQAFGPETASAIE